ncbi:hypothetical protein VTI28DRAFT_766 [Corynascus sepedonium]
MQQQRRPSRQAQLAASKAGPGVLSCESNLQFFVGGRLSWSERAIMLTHPEPRRGVCRNLDESASVFWHVWPETRWVNGCMANRHRGQVFKGNGNSGGTY